MITFLATDEGEAAGSWTMVQAASTLAIAVKILRSDVEKIIVCALLHNGV